MDPLEDHRGHRLRLKERFRTAGLAAFSDHEVLELLLTYAIPQKDVKPQAKALLCIFGSLKKVLDADLTDLEKVSGISAHSGILLKLIKETAALYLQRKALEKQQVTCTSELLDYCRSVMGAKKDEEFAVIYLDVQNQIIAMETIQRGIVSQAVVYPRQVLESALKKKASGIILAHNHPSGHVWPSEADVRLTRTIEEAAKVLDILVHDHIILAEDRFFSFREEGMITRSR